MKCSDTILIQLRISLCWKGFCILSSGALSEELDVMSAREAEMGSLYVRKAVEFIQDNFCNPIHITDIADYVCINRSYLYTLFQRELSVSPKEYLANYRLTRASELCS